jgi:hypothetical protein
MVGWPAPSDYANAVQNPSLSFIDIDLAASQPILNAMGLPKSASGQNAIVFPIRSTTGMRAVRCFSSAPDSVDIRYKALGRYIRQSGCASLVVPRWVDRGINVHGRSWPLTVMEWIDGRRLDKAVEIRLNNPSALRELATRILTVVQSIQSSHIAHGDLQHGNILVTDNLDVRLVDLDGTWVPGIEGLGNRELGHRNFQHPKRTEGEWGPLLDTFSALVIYTSIRAIAADPDLWRFHGDENLIFSDHDLAEPGGTELWACVTASPDAEVGCLAQILVDFAAGPASLAMTLDDLMGAGAVPDPSSDLWHAKTSTDLYTADDLEALRFADPVDDEGPSVGLPWLRTSMTAPPMPQAPTVDRMRAHQRGDSRRARLRSGVRAQWISIGRNSATRAPMNATLAAFIGITGFTIASAAGVPKFSIAAFFTLASATLSTLSSHSQQLICTGSLALRRAFVGFGFALFISAMTTATTSVLYWEALKPSQLMPWAASGMAFAFAAFVLGNMLGSKPASGLTSGAFAAIAGFAAGAVVGNGKVAVTASGGRSLFVLTAGIACIGLFAGRVDAWARQSFLHVEVGPMAGYDVALQARSKSLGARGSDFILPGVADNTWATVTKGKKALSISGVGDVHLGGQALNSFKRLHDGDVVTIANYTLVASVQRKYRR